MTAPDGRRWYQCNGIPQDFDAGPADMARTWGVGRASGLTVREDFHCALWQPAQNLPGSTP